ncbi:MAG: isopenicillin N synthase family dioxygenase [Pseudomonadales bacterium]
MNKLPVLDISALTDVNAQESAKATAQRKLELACRDIGFVIVRGHGIPTSVIESARAATHAFFELSLEKKTQYQISSNNYRGYIPLGFFDAATGDYAADQYEGYKLHWQAEASDQICSECDLYGPNKWPSEVPQLHVSIASYWQACDQLSATLLNAFEKILGIEPGYFAEVFEQPLTNMTLLRYPPKNSEQAFGIHPHKDTDVLTIVAPDPSGGLFLRPRNSEEWLSADAPDDCLIINIGDMLELWSGGYFMSTPHKVENTSRRQRISFPYFAVPRYDTVIKPLIANLAGFDRQPIHVGDISREVWRTNWAETKPIDDSLDLGTLKN